MTFGISRKMDMGFGETIERVREELTKEGFGVLTEIDVKATMKEKLGIDYRDYIILGACNPPFAKKALDVDPQVGLMLPCNVIVYDVDGKTVVSAINPSEVLNIVENAELEDVASEVEKKLANVVSNL